MSERGVEGLARWHAVFGSQTGPLTSFFRILDAIISCVAVEEGRTFTLYRLYAESSETES